MADKEREIEVIVQSGTSFFYDDGTPAAGSRLTVPEHVARNWRSLGMAEPANPGDLGPPEPASKAVDRGPTEAPAPTPTEYNATAAAVDRARELEVHLGEVEGTGEEGRILVKDVERHHASFRAGQEE